MRIKFECDECPAKFLMALTAAIVGDQMVVNASCEKLKDGAKWSGYIDTIPGKNLYISGQSVYAELPRKSAAEMRELSEAEEKSGYKNFIARSESLCEPI